MVKTKKRRCHVTAALSLLLPLCSAVGLTSRSKHSPQTVQIPERTKFPRSKREAGGRWGIRSDTPPYVLVTVFLKGRCGR